MADSYATVDDFEDYVEGWVTSDEEALQRMLERASRDVDRYIGAAWSVEDNGLRFGKLEDNPKAIDQYQIEALTRATCAQAEYRIEMGPDFFVKDQHKSVGGPDFSTQGKLSRYGPKMREEVQASGLQRATGGRLVR